ncbi:hypothetical protein QM012_009120 [Aureobasidium pullulans]|uniref:F-box domain-containing protein n=1 Tax=Aureobasidium pullulans TaxID=5580 RepID=A0ABR0TK14_AURPU
MPRNLNLPVELLDRIIWFTIPDLNYLAYPASHATTKTLLALCRVSRATSCTAKTLLYTHCLYIDKPWRLDLLLTRYFFQSNSPTLISRIENLYLSPFSGGTIREKKVVTQIAELFTLLGPSLKRLVNDMPLRSHYPEEDITDQLRPILRRGFEQLIHLEEFCSVKDELYLAYWDPTSSQQAHDDEVNDFMFENWRYLRRIALYNQMLDSDFRSALTRMPNLESIVLSRPDYEEDIGSWMRDMGIVFRNRVHSTYIDTTETASEAGLRILHHTDVPEGTQFDTWSYGLLVGKEDDPISSVQDWSLRRALDGSLWCLPDARGLDLTWCFNERGARVV